MFTVYVHAAVSIVGHSAWPYKAGDIWQYYNCVVLYGTFTLQCKYKLKAHNSDWSFIWWSNLEVRTWSNGITIYFIHDLVQWSYSCDIMKKYCQFDINKKINDSTYYPTMSYHGHITT